MKLQENNTEENLYDLEFGNRFLHAISKALFWKKGNLHFIKLKTSDRRPYQNKNTSHIMDENICKTYV